MQSEYKVYQADGEQARMQRSAVNHKKADQIEKLSDKELVDQLKLKGLESFGTKHEKIDRLKRHFGRLLLRRDIRRARHEEEGRREEQLREGDREDEEEAGRAAREGLAEAAGNHAAQASERSGGQVR